VRAAPYALRVVQRTAGTAAILYRRRADSKGRDRLQRIGALAPLAYSAGLPMLRVATQSHSLRPGAYAPLDDTWGPRLACYAILTAGLRDGERMLRAAEHLRRADPDQAAWWLGLLLQPDNVRAVRALRILTEAVQ